MRNIVKTTLALTIVVAMITGCSTDSIVDSIEDKIGDDIGDDIDEGIYEGSSLNDIITFSGTTSNFTITWKKVYNQYSEVVVKPEKKLASSNYPETVTIDCRHYNTSSQDLYYACHPSNLSAGTDYSFQIAEGSSVELGVLYKETAAGSGYGTTEGQTQFTLVNSNGNLIKQ